MAHAWHSACSRAPICARRGASSRLLIGSTDNIGGTDRRDLKQEFRYAENQGPLMREFWVRNARECLNKPFVGNTLTDLPSASSNDEGSRQHCEHFYEGECYDDNW